MSLRSTIQKSPKELLLASDFTVVWTAQGQNRCIGASPEGFTVLVGGIGLADGVPIFRLDLGRVRQSFITVACRLVTVGGAGNTTYTPTVRLHRSDDVEVDSIPITGGIVMSAVSDEIFSVTFTRAAATENELYIVIDTVTGGGSREVEFQDVYVIETIYDDIGGINEFNLSLRPFERSLLPNPDPYQIRGADPEVVAVHRDIGVSTGGVPGTSADLNQLDRDVADHTLVFAGRPNINYFRGDTTKTAVVRQKVDPFVGTRLQVGMMWFDTTSVLRVTVEIEDDLGAVVASRNFSNPGAVLELLRTNFDMQSLVGPPTDLFGLPGTVVIYVWSDAAQTARVQGIRILQGTADGSAPERYLQAVPP